MRTLSMMLALGSSSAFLATPRLETIRMPHLTHDCQMGLFDGFAKAFANDDTLGARENAGLSKEAQKRTVTWIGPKGQKKQVR